MNISHTKVDLYQECGAKYKFRYIDRLVPDKTFSSLLFGSAIDQALNYVLLRVKHGHIPYAETAKSVFYKQMDEWEGQNDFEYYKNELPAHLRDAAPASGDNRELQVACWEHLCSVGAKIIDKYILEVLPNFQTILSVQTKKEIKNEEDDVLVLVVDFTAQLKDGRIVTFDNKTTTNVKKNYPKTAVKKSQQLSIYSEYSPSRLCGYIVLGKMLDEQGDIEWKMIVDEIEEERVNEAFAKVDNALTQIKLGVFEKNEKQCFGFGKKCVYWDMCKKANPKGLIQKKAYK